MSLAKMLAVAEAEFRAMTRSKAFIISIVVLPILYLALPQTVLTGFLVLTFSSALGIGLRPLLRARYRRVLIPTLIAGIYGMNFAHMPELNWRFGYVYALGLMLVSAMLLYRAFKRRDWL